MLVGMSSRLVAAALMANATVCVALVVKPAAGRLFLSGRSGR
jgi:hypothetical protein